MLSIEYQLTTKTVGITFGTNQAVFFFWREDKIAVKVFSRPRPASSKEIENFFSPSNCLQVSMI